MCSKTLVLFPYEYHGRRTQDNDTGVVVHNIICISTAYEQVARIDVNL